MTRKVLCLGAFGLALAAAFSANAATDDASSRRVTTVAVSAGQGGTILVQVPQEPRPARSDAPYALTGAKQQDSQGRWILMRAGQSDFHWVRLGE
jgi:hypothetical protein